MGLGLSLIHIDVYKRQAQIGALESETKAFASKLTSKAAAAPSDAWKMIFAAPPESVLWLVHTSKTGPLAARFKAFFNEWSQARTRIPYQLMQEMRIVPELPIYNELLDKLFFALMDNKLDTPEACLLYTSRISPHHLRRSAAQYLEPVVVCRPRRQRLHPKARAGIIHLHQAHRRAACIDNVGLHKRGPAPRQPQQSRHCLLYTSRCV